MCKLNPDGDNFVSLRAGPDRSHPEILRLGENTKLKKLEAQGAWYYVRMRNGTLGWVYSRWLCPGLPQ